MSTNSIVSNLKRYPLAVSSAVLLIISVAVIFLRGDVLLELEATESELNGRIRTIEQNIINSNGLDAEVEQLEAEVVSIDGRLFDRSQSAVNANFFYGFEKKADVLITGVNQLQVDDAILSKGGPNELKLYTALVYEIGCEGGFSQILSFLFQLHAANPLIRVADFQISEGSKAAPGALTAKLRVLVLARQN
ncbi:MAG: hypothetical protein ACSHX4_09995 [Opitutaceae bacterium]